MEEVYVIRLRGVPSTSTSESSTSAIDTNDLIRGSVLGLGVLHVIFGLLVVVFGVLRTSIDDEPAATFFGTIFGPFFVATGVCAFLSWRRPFRKLKMKCAKVFGDTPHVTANAIVATMGEMIVALLSVLTAGGAVWKFWQCGAFRPTTVHQNSARQKVIVKTDIIGGQSVEGVFDDEMIRHVSPHCVISLRAGDGQREVIKKVQDYLHSQDELSFTFSDPSSLHDEQDLGVDSQNWRNEVIPVTSSQDSENGENNVVEKDDESEQTLPEKEINSVWTLEN
ncbi:uncharacterized protein TNCT_695031 [Trichonephila clavata]|uniref:Transmembrane protein n=1 Tax=Trichonephila clavata TaxID=2740835 RepID=A0A8X6FI50_TRICU|nr:uncharacterized protein TNCT_695031 [Trichonephila clavata]